MVLIAEASGQGQAGVLSAGQRSGERETAGFRRKRLTSSVGFIQKLAKVKVV